MSEHTKAFGADTAALQRVHGPVVVLESVHELQDGAHSANGGVDGGCPNELRRQVCVEWQLDLYWQKRTVRVSAFTMSDRQIALPRRNKLSVSLWCSNKSWILLQDTSHRRMRESFSAAIVPALSVLCCVWCFDAWSSQPSSATLLTRRWHFKQGSSLRCSFAPFRLAYLLSFPFCTFLPILSFADTRLDTTAGALWAHYSGHNTKDPP